MNDKYQVGYIDNDSEEFEILYYRGSYSECENFINNTSDILVDLKPVKIK